MNRSQLNYHCAVFTLPHPQVARLLHRNYLLYLSSSTLSKSHIPPARTAVRRIVAIIPRMGCSSGTHLVIHLYVMFIVTCVYLQNKPPRGLVLGHFSATAPDWSTGRACSDSCSTDSLNLSEPLKCTIDGWIRCTQPRSDKHAHRFQSSAAGQRPISKHA